MCNELIWGFHCLFFKIAICLDFPGGAGGKELTCQGRRYKRRRFSPWIRKIPGRGNVNSLQYSCLEHPMDREVQWAMVHGVAKSQAWLKWLSMYIHLPPLFWGKVHWIDYLTFPIVFSQTPQIQHMQYWIYHLFPNLQVFSVPSLSKGHYHLHSGPT